MKNDTRLAYERLCDGGLTCVLCSGEKFYCSSERGVKPLVEFVESDTDFSGYCAADKIVGNAAAFLYAVMGIDEVYAEVISSAAAKTLEKHGIKAYFGKEVETIINRSGTGICPMEQAVSKAVSPEDAYKKIKDKLRQLQQG